MGKSDWAALAAFIAGNAMNILADQFPKWVGWGLMLLAVLIFIHGRIPDTWTPRCRIILLVSIALLGTLSIWFFYRRHEAIPKISESTEKFYSTPLSLRDLFESDFSNYILVWSYIEGTDPDSGESLKAPAALAFDPAAGTKFLSFYIPHCREILLRSALTHILNDRENIIEKAQSSLPMNTHQAGSTGRSTLQDSVFSNRIYVYYENDLDLQHLAAWESEFAAKGVVVHFRGIDYLSVHINEKRHVVNGVPR
jgi:hypothetical protein